MISSKANKSFSGSTRYEVRVQESEIMEQEARMAISFIERWGMIAAEDDGEDSAGRHKIRLMTPAEVVKRAFVTAKLAMAHVRASGLVHILPDIFPLEAEAEAKETAEEEEKRQRQGGRKPADEGTGSRV